MEFNDFIILWGHVGATLGKCLVNLGLLWVYDGGFGSPFDLFGASLGTRYVYVGAWVCRFRFRVSPLALFEGSRAAFQENGGFQGGWFWVTFVSLWCHCEVSLGSLCIPLGHFEATLGI